MVVTNSYLLVDDDEQIQYVLGKKHCDTFLETGELKNGFFAAVTNKRLYIRGNKKGIVWNLSEDVTIDLNSVKGVRVERQSSPLSLIYGSVVGILTVICSVIGVNIDGTVNSLLTYVLLAGAAICLMMTLGFIGYYTVTSFKKMTVFCTGSGDGLSYTFNPTGVTDKEIKKFGRQLFLAKEKSI